MKSHASQGFPRSPLHRTQRKALNLRAALLAFFSCELQQVCFRVVPVVSLLIYAPSPSLMTSEPKKPAAIAKGTTLYQY